MLRNTVFQLLGDAAGIDYSLVADFASFTGLTRLLGTIEVESKCVSTVGTFLFPTGPIVLNEQDSSTYVRQRDTLPNSDLDRAERHRATLTVCWTGWSNGWRPTRLRSRRLSPICTTMWSSPAISP